MFKDKKRWITCSFPHIVLLKQIKLDMGEVK